MKIEKIIQLLDDNQIKELTLKKSYKKKEIKRIANSIKSNTSLNSIFINLNFFNKSKFIIIIKCLKKKQTTLTIDLPEKIPNKFIKAMKKKFNLANFNDSHKQVLQQEYHNLLKIKITERVNLFNMFPHEIKLLIFAFFREEELIRIADVCREWTFFSSYTYHTNRSDQEELLELTKLKDDSDSYQKIQLLFRNTLIKDKLIKDPRDKYINKINRLIKPNNENQNNNYFTNFNVMLGAPFAQSQYSLYSAGREYNYKMAKYKIKLEEIEQYKGPFNNTTYSEISKKLNK